MLRAAAVVLAAVIGAVAGVLTLAAIDAWQRQPPSSDGWLTFAGAVLGSLLAVLGAYLVGRWSAHREAELALNNAMAVLREERAAQRADDDESRRRSDTAFFRFPIVDLIDECRKWLEANPLRDEGVTVARLNGERLDVAGRVRNLLNTEQFPPELLGYLLWSVSHLERTNEGFQASLRAVKDNTSGARVDRDKWWGIVDRLQVITCLLIAEARRRGLSDIVETFEGNTWLVPLPGGEREREIAESQNPGRFGAPPWPTDPAYAACSPAQRDGAAAAAVGQVGIRPSGRDQVSRPSAPTASRRSPP
jgi:hypothetical protein